MGLPRFAHLVSRTLNTFVFVFEYLFKEGEIVNRRQIDSLSLQSKGQNAYCHYKMFRCPKLRFLSCNEIPCVHLALSHHPMGIAGQKADKYALTWEFHVFSQHP